MSKQRLFTGSAVALVTAFKEDYSIDYNKMEELIEWHIQNKTDAIVICGTTGEASAMDNQEQIDLIAFTVKKVNKRIPVIAGTGSNNTKKAIELSKASQQAGADGLLLVTPYYNKTTQKGLIAHFSAIANSVTIPCVLYDVPSRTGMSIAVDTYKELAKVKNIVATKEATGDLSHIAQIMAACRGNLEVYAGNDDQIVPILSLGGIGVISVLANILPKQTHDICENYFKKEIELSAKSQLDYLDLMNVLFCETNPIPVKAALNLMGKEVGPCRLPLVEMEPKNLEKVKEQLNNHGLV